MKEIIEQALREHRNVILRDGRKAKIAAISDNHHDDFDSFRVIGWILEDDNKTGGAMSWHINGRCFSKNKENRIDIVGIEKKTKVKYGWMFFDKAEPRLAVNLFNNEESANNYVFFMKQFDDYKTAKVVKIEWEE